MHFSNGFCRHWLRRCISGEHQEVTLLTKKKNTIHLGVILENRIPLLGSIKNKSLTSVCFKYMASQHPYPLLNNITFTKSYRKFAEVPEFVIIISICWWKQIKWNWSECMCSMCGRSRFCWQKYMLLNWAEQICKFVQCNENTHLAFSRWGCRIFLNQATFLGDCALLCSR